MNQALSQQENNQGSQPAREGGLVKEKSHQENVDSESKRASTFDEVAKDGTDAALSAVAAGGRNVAESERQQRTVSVKTSTSFAELQGHALQTNWQFWYYQRQSPQQFAAQQDPNDGQARQESKPEAQAEASQPVDDGTPSSQQEPKLWRPKKQKTKTYREQLKPLGLISSIEHFFNFYVFMKKPSEMPREIDIFFFRQQEVPMWEESPDGGIWIIKIKRDDNIDKMWESILFAMIGEQFEEPKVIGASLSLRTKEKLLQVWLKDGRNERIRNNVSNKMRHFLNLNPSAVTLYYKEHQKSIKDGSTMKNAEGFKFMHQEAPSNGARGNHHNSRGGGGFNSSRKNGQYRSSRDLQPWNSLGASQEETLKRSGKGSRTYSNQYQAQAGPERNPNGSKPSAKGGDQKNQPFHKLGAEPSASGAQKHRTVRDKANSHV